MKYLRRIVVGGWLLAGTVVVTAVGGTTPAADRDQGRKQGGEFNAKPAKGEKYRNTLKVGDSAPDFTLPELSGKQVTLSNSGGKKPAVLIFGSCTCPPFRRQIGEVERIYQSYKEKADFLLVYIREAHPGSKIPGINGGQVIDQTETLAERMKLAAEFAEELKLTMPVVVDKEDNKVNAAYAGWPNRFVIVGVDGKIAYLEKSGAGFKWGEVEDWLSHFVAGAGAVAANTAKVAPATEIRGKISKVNAEDNTPILTVDGKDQTFPIDKEAKFVALGRKRQLQDLPGGLAGVKDGNEVTVITEIKDGKELVTKVTVEGSRRKKDKP